MPIKKAAAVALIYGDMVLLGKRCKEWEGIPINYGGYWSFFGGSVEEGESPALCAARELLEETEIKVEAHNLKYISSFIEDDLEFIAYSYDVEEAILPTLNKEHTEYGWFKLNFLRNFIEKIDPKIIECVELYRRKADNKEASPSKKTK